MKKCKVVGYIDHITKDTELLILIPIYQHEGELFFHSLSKDFRTIEFFTPYLKQNYEHDKYFVEIPDGPEKEPGQSSFFVFKYENEIFSGSCDDRHFASRMHDCKKRIGSESAKREIEEIFG